MNEEMKKLDDYEFDDVDFDDEGRMNPVYIKKLNSDKIDKGDK